MSTLPRTTEVDPLEPHLGDRIRIARERSGFKLGDFATAIGCDRGSLSDYEKGLAIPRRYILKAIADEVGLTLEQLVGPGGVEAGPEGGPGLSLLGTPPGTRTQNLRVSRPVFIPDQMRMTG